MKKANKVFLIFIIFVAFLIGIIWEGLQTKTFSSLFSEQIGPFVKKKYQVRVNFEKIEISLWPPETLFKGVRISSQKNILEADSLGFRFDPSSFFIKDAWTGKILIRNGSLTISAKSSSKKKVPLKDYVGSYKNFFEKIMAVKAKGLELENFLVETPREDFSIVFLDIKKRYRHLTLYGEASNSNTSFSFDLKAKKKKLEINSLLVRRKTDEVDIKGTVQIKKEIPLDLMLRSHGDTRFLSEALKTLFQVDTKELDGFFKLKMSIQGDWFSPYIKGNFYGHEIRSTFAKIDSTQIKFMIKNSKFNVLKVKAYCPGGSLQTLQPFEFIDLKKNKISVENIKLQAKNLRFKDVVYFNKGRLSELNFRMTGPIHLEFYDKYLKIVLNKRPSIKNLSFKNKGSKIPLFSNVRGQLLSGSSLDIKYDGPVGLDLSFKMKNGHLNWQGEIGSDVFISVEDSFIDFKDFGLISGLPIQGRGPIRGTIEGPLHDTLFKFDTDFHEFSLPDLNLGNLKGEITYHLKESKFTSPRFNGHYGKTTYQGRGAIFFEGKENLDIYFTIKEGLLDEAKRMLPKVALEMKRYLKLMDFNFSSKFHVGGGFTVDKMKVNGVIKGYNAVFLGETFNEFKGRIFYDSLKSSLRDLKLKKFKNSITGTLSYDLSSGKFSHRFSTSSFQLGDIDLYKSVNLGLKGLLAAEYFGEGDSKTFSSQGYAKIFNARIGERKLKDSALTMRVYDKAISGHGAFLGDQAGFQVYINLDSQKNLKKSFIKGVINIEDARIPLSMISTHNISDPSIHGHWGLSLVSSFEGTNWKKADFDIKMDNAFFEKGNISFALKSPQRISIKNGVIKKWGVNLQGEGLHFHSQGKGDFNDKFSINSLFSFDAGLLELLTPKLEKSTGVFRGRLKTRNGKKGPLYSLALEGQDLDFKIDQIPGTFNKTKLQVLWEQKNLFLKSFNSQYRGGGINSKGKIKLKFPFPLVDIDLGMKNLRVPSPAKSNIVLNGQLNLKGDHFPYIFKGNLDILYGEIKDELKDLLPKQEIQYGYQRFRPKRYTTRPVDRVKADIKVNILKPIVVKNNLLDLSLKGQGHIFNSLFSPYINGLLELADAENKFVFKGHEFKLNEGRIFLKDKRKKHPLELKVSGASKVNEYDILMDIEGPVKDLKITMQSNPPLGQRDIFGLLTLGVTSTISQALGDKEQQSVATLGIGGLILDQFGINQNLKDKWGIHLKVTSDFEEDEALLDRKFQSSSIAKSKLSSYTKVQIQKKINKKVNFSVSGRLGESNESKRDMAVDVKIKKDVLLKGVYEIRSSEDLNYKNLESFGIDFIRKFKF